MRLLFSLSKRELFLCEEILLLAVLDELLYENVGAGLGRLVHADALDHALGTGLGIKGCNCFLCHSLFSFII